MFSVEPYKSRKADFNVRAIETRAKEEEMEALFQKEKEKEIEMFSKMKYAGAAGAFEGAAYLSKGMYRSAINCIIFTRDLTFCPVCQRSISRVIDRYTK